MIDNGLGNIKGILQQVRNLYEEILSNKNKDMFCLEYLSKILEISHDMCHSERMSSEPFYEALNKSKSFYYYLEQLKELFNIFLAKKHVAEEYSAIKNKKNCCSRLTERLITNQSIYGNWNTNYKYINPNELLNYIESIINHVNVLIKVYDKCKELHNHEDELLIVYCIKKKFYDFKNTKVVSNEYPIEKITNEYEQMIRWR